MSIRKYKCNWFVPTSWLLDCINAVFGHTSVKCTMVATCNMYTLWFSLPVTDSPLLLIIMTYNK